MVERKFKITDQHGNTLASDMTIEMTLVFIKGYENSFYNEILNLRIIEMTVINE
jgi:hypothetical protein